MSMIVADICLDDIPQGKIQTSRSNGKRYLKVCIGEMRQPDNWGNTHTIWADKRQGEPIVYVGKARIVEPGQGQQSQPAQPQPQQQPIYPQPAQQAVQRTVEHIVNDYPNDLPF